MATAGESPAPADMSMAAADLGVVWAERTTSVTDEVGRAVLAQAIELGYTARRLETSEDDSKVGRVLFVNVLADRAALVADRPAGRRTMWFGEPLPLPTSALGSALRSFSSARLIGAAMSPLPQRARPRWLRALRARAAAEREPVRNLHMLRRIEGAIDRLAVNTAWTNSLAGYAHPVIPAMWGYHQTTCGPFVDPTRPRDIDVLVLATAKDPDGRREHILERIVAALEPEVRVMRVAAGVLGSDRHELLARTRVVLDIHRVAGNFAPLRLVGSAAAGAVVVSEPYVGAFGLEAGRHFLEAEIDQLAGTCRELLRDEDRRRIIASAAQEAARGVASMAYNLALVLGGAPGA